MNLMMDDFLSPEDFANVRGRAISASYVDWESPLDGEIYKRVWVGAIPEMETALSRMMDRDIFMVGQAFRLNYEGETPNRMIHTDVGHGDLAAVLYLNEHENSGTAFFEHKETGRNCLFPGEMRLDRQLRNDYNNPDKWDITHHIPAKQNRVIVYSSYMFHSRYPFAGHGTTPEDGRLIAVAFFK